MSKHLFAFKCGDYVEVTGGTYAKPYEVCGTVKKDVLQRGTFVHVEFDEPQVGNTAVQRLRGYVSNARIAKTNLRIYDPPTAEPVPADEREVGTANVSAEDMSSVSSDGVLHHLDRLDMEDTRISKELRLRIRDLCKCFKREGFSRHSPSIQALIAMGLNEVDHWD